MQYTAIHRDYPHEIAAARKSLWNLYKQARASGNNRVSIQYPARLVVNGVTTHDCFPDWDHVMKGQVSLYRRLCRPRYHRVTYYSGNPRLGIRQDKLAVMPLWFPLARQKKIAQDLMWLRLPVVLPELLVMVR